ncbi:MAG: molybdenum cofactor guanylyltransferase MobA [Hyphomicrobiaceae bacterium]|nr:molybdenum cofactor guanylyltransferase MobA [Hyphomicrobiaceae bacterium]
MAPTTVVDKSRIAGILLAGGQSRRMFDGTGAPGDKGLLDIAGKPMLAHAIERLAPQVGAMAINANGDPSRFAAFGLPVIADSVGGFAGPLAGVLAGMTWARDHAPGTTHIATVSSDAPFLPSDLVERLAATIGPGKPIALAASGGELHPVIGLWPVTLAHDLETQLRDGVRKVLAWTDRHGTSAAEFEHREIAGERIDPFFNANTPAELDEARRLLALASARKD